MRNVILFIALALIFASVAAADTLTDSNGVLVYPDGATITSETYIPSTAENEYSGFTSVSFAGPGYTGAALDNIPNGGGDAGNIVFNVPVTNLTVTWEDSVGLYLNFYSYDYGELGSYTEPVCTSAPCFGTIDFADPGALEMTFTTSQNGYDAAGYGGISSLSFDSDPTPEPPELILLAMGLMALLAGCAFLKRPAYFGLFPAR